MTRVVTCASLDYEIEALEQLMDCHQLHCIPIIDNANQCVGVISLMDLVHCRNISKNSATLQAWDICSQPVVTVDINATVLKAMEEMAKNNIHHSVVVDDEELVGIVSTIDMINYIIGQ